MRREDEASVSDLARERRLALRYLVAGGLSTVAVVALMIAGSRASVRQIADQGINIDSGLGEQLIGFSLMPFALVFLGAGVGLWRRAKARHFLHGVGVVVVVFLAIMVGAIAVAAVAAW